MLQTASNFPEFLKRTDERKYDFIETAPHFVPRAVNSGRYEVLTTITQPLSAYIVVKSTANFYSVKELAGKIIATPSPKAVITKLGKETLSNMGLRDSNKPVYENHRTHNAAYEAVLGGQADAAIISVNVFNKALKKNAPLRAIAKSKLIPNMSILVATDLPEPLKNVLLRSLVEMGNNPDGREVMKKMTYPGYRKAELEEFTSLIHYFEPLSN